MKHLKKTALFLMTVLTVCFISCKEKKQKLNPELSSINLKRGELLLCSTESFGEVNFSLSCSYETRETFDLALSLLHSFEYTEAEKAFVKVIHMDPDCAMAYWGVSMSIFQSLWMQSDLSYLEKGNKLLKIANKLPKSDLEKDYLDAINIYYKDWENIDKATRKKMYEKKMEALYNKHKGDTEATVFYALAILAAADPNDKSYTRQKKSGKILEDLFTEKPNHPGIAHYIIHNYDYPELAEKALPTARRYAEIAPASAHAQHMPSHVFTRLGLWDESISSNINSASSANCYGKKVNPEATWGAEIHAVDYLVYAYLQNGNNQKANEYLLETQAITAVFPKQNFASAYALTAIPVRIALENKQWENAANLKLPSIDFTWETLHWETAIMHFGKALGYSHTGNIKAAEKELQTLELLHQNLLNANEEYKAKQVNVQVHSAKAWIEFAKENKEEALVFMKKATYLENLTTKHPVTPGEVLPADELLGDMLLALNQPKEALEAYEVNLKGHPNRFNGIYGAAVASKKSGDQEKALSYFKLLVKLSDNSNSDRIELKEAKDFIKNNNLT